MAFSRSVLVSLASPRDSDGRLRLRLIVVASIVALVAVFFPASASAAPPAVVSSLTVQDQNGAPIIDALLHLYDASTDEFYGYGVSEQDGEFAFYTWDDDPLVLPSSVVLKVSLAFNPPGTTSYLMYFWNGSAFVESSDVEEPITFGTSGSPFVTTLPLTLPSGSISGTVATIPERDTVVGLYAALWSTGNPVGGAPVDADGGYTIPGVAPGTYRLEFRNSTYTSSPYGYEEAWFGGSTYGEADDVVVGGGAVTGRDVTVQEFGRISGSLYEVVGGSQQPLSSAGGVVVYPADSSPSNDDAIEIETFDADYEIDLPAGSYRVAFDRFSSESGSHVFDAEQYYDIVGSEASATTVVVEPGVEDSGIDAVFGAILGGSQPVYRFWSSTKKSHFYTISVAERDAVIANYDDSEWLYEGPAYQAYATDVPDAEPLYRFWSSRYQGHFYTASAAEKDAVIANYPDDEWLYEGIAYYILPSDAGPGSTGVARFWSQQNRHHFYTASETERDFVIDNYDDLIWAYEGTAFSVPND